MRYKASEMPQVHIQYGMYELSFPEKYASMKEAEINMCRVHDIMRRKFQGREQEVSYLLGISNVKGGVAIKESQKVGKVGRPFISIAGPKVEPHIHGIVYGKNACARSLEATNRINNVFKRTIVKTFKLDGYDYVGYVLRQCVSIRTFGDFEWKALEPLFHIVIEE